MPDEHHILQVQLPAQLENVLRVTVKAGVPLRVVGRHVGLTGTDMVEYHHPEPVLERRRDVTPHVLITAEPVREQHRLTINRTGQRDVMTAHHIHSRSLASRACPANHTRPPGRGHGARPGVRCSGAGPREIAC